MDELIRREREFFDACWQDTTPRRIEGRLEIPGVELRGKRVLICSCGSGIDVVLAGNAGAEVYAFDISPTAVAKAREVAAFNGVRVVADEMDFHELRYPDAYFDVIFGSSILHHVECGKVGGELWRCLRPGGVAYFFENSDRNPVLRWFRRLAFGNPGEVQRERFLFFRRYGSPDEYPLTVEELRELAQAFPGRLTLSHDRFVFFELLAIHGWHAPRFRKLMQGLDALAVRVAPGLLPYSFEQYVRLERPA